MNPTTTLSTPKSSFGTPSRPANHNGNARSHSNNGTTPALPTSSDFTLYDKARLLRLAERSQPRKDATSRSTPGPTLAQTNRRPGVNGNVGFATPLGKLEKLSNGGTVRTKLKNATPSDVCDFQTPSSSNFSSKARSKLYASFSSKKSKPIKSDPARTNIEHLVKNTRTPSSTSAANTSINGSASQNYYNGSDSSSICSSITNHCNSIERPVTPFHEEPIDTSFHNHAKLISAFSPTPSTLSSASSSSIHSLAKRSQHGLLGRNHNGKYYAMQNEVSPTHENGHAEPSQQSQTQAPFHDATQQSQSAAQQHQPRISSAQIVSLSRKASFPSAAMTDDDDNSKSKEFSSDNFRQPQTFNTKAIENQSRAAQSQGLHDGSSAWLHDTHAESQSSPTKTMVLTTSRCSVPSTASSSQLLSSNGAIIPPPPISSRKTISKQKLSESETEDLRTRARQRRHVNGSTGQSQSVDAESDNSNLCSHDGTRMQMQTEVFPQSQQYSQPQIQMQSPRRTGGRNNYFYNRNTPRPVEAAVYNSGARSRTAFVFNDNLTNEVPASYTTSHGRANHDSTHNAGYEWSRRGSRNTEAVAAEHDIHKITNFYESELYNRNEDELPAKNCAGADAYNCNYDIDANDNEDSAQVHETSAAADEDFDRKKTRSLPRSLMSMKTGLRNVKLPSWNQEDATSEGADQTTLISNRYPDVKIAPSGSMMPRSPVVATAYPKTVDSTRQQPQQRQQSSQRTNGRPKSVDYSQRNSWMKAYSNMELASVNGKTSSKSPSPISSPSEEKPISSISRLHLIDSHEDVRQWRSAARADDRRLFSSADQRDSPDCSSGIGSNSSRSNSLTEQNKARLGVGSPSATPETSAPTATNSQSLFQRFSKTFSLRFGGAKDLEHHGSSRKKVKQNRRYLGSSPDLVSRIANETDKRNSTDSAKHRKGSQKAAREDKCQSGDSGIQVLVAENDDRPKRLITRSNNVNRTSHLRNSMNRLSLVEFPNQNSTQKPNRQISLLSTNTVSYEDLLDGKLDDDGFISNDEDDDDLVQVDEEEEDHDSFNNNTLRKSPDNAYYNSLPAKYLRQKRSTKKPIAGTTEMSSSIRGNIVRELLTTERNYVKTLNDIVQGYLIPCRQAKHLFSSKIVSNIFSNIEDLLKLHVQFLHDLQFAIENSHNQNHNGSDSGQPSPTNYCSSLVGHVFIVWSDQFHHLYSDYCCQNTMSIVTLRQLTSMSSEYVDFFETCRRRQLMDKLPLHGFLLRPIQRICQYHLQLSELVKHTPFTHDDFEAVTEALERMKLVATNVNETQRQFDALQELARLQISIEGFEGPDLLDRNISILHCGDLVQMNQGSKHKEVYVMVLNQEVIICRKDTSKKGALTMNTRIDLNSSPWVNIDSNEEDDYFGMVHNSWRLYNPYKCSWILFTASSPTDKRKWTSALEQTIEQDKFHISSKMREMAKLTATQILLTDSLLSFSSSTATAGSGPGAQNSTSTLPKLKKNGNRKSFTKSGGDTSSSRTDLLINDVKLRSKNCNTSNNSHASSNNNNNNNNNGPVRTSKFYV